MKKLLMKQHLFSFSEKFDITDDNENVLYNVSGSMFSIPKYFDIFNTHGVVVAHLSHAVFSFLPKFTLAISDFSEEVELVQRFTFLRPKFDIEGLGLRIDGDVWDMNFTIIKNNRKIGYVNQRWLAMSSTYDISIEDESLETVVVSLIVAIDYIKAQRHTHVSAIN